MSKESDKNLSRIRELTEFVKMRGEKVHYDLEQGSCEGVNLMNDGEVAVQYAVLAPDTVFPLHTHHDSKEILICIEGKFENIKGEIKTIALYSDIIEIRKGESHHVYTKDGCKIIGITIPANEGYPK
jgi:quercetin dioxygenase-like cupin family protein